MIEALVIFDTKFGNTRKMAVDLARGMKKNGANVDCLEVREVDVNKLNKYDFLAVGGPTHMLSISGKMKEFLEKLKTVDIEGKKGFCFDTRVKSRFNTFDLNGAAKRIEKKLKKMKVEMIKPHKSAIVEGREGPLEEGTEEKFEKIGAELAKYIQQL